MSDIRNTKEIGWLGGILDGDGTFSIGFQKNPRHKTGFQINPLISVSQKDKKRLEVFCNILNKYGIKTGVIRKTRGGRGHLCHVVQIQGIDNTLNLCKLLDDEDVVKWKKNDLEKLMMVLDLMKKKLHLNPKVLLTIAKLRDNMHLNYATRRKYTYDYLRSALT